MRSRKCKHIWNRDSLKSLSQPVRKQEEKKNLVLTNLQEDAEPAVQCLHAFLVLIMFNAFHPDFSF